MEPSAASDLRAEARLWVEWARGAAGPWLPAEEPPPAAKPIERRSASGAQPPGAVPAQHLPTGAVAAGAAPSEPPETDVARTPAERAARLETLCGEVAACNRCLLAASRTQTVFGEGPAGPRLVIVGEAPGAEEDRTGRPFVGVAGRLLTKMLAAIGLAREDVYIANLLKCRPPGNRNPRPDEVAACHGYLHEQLRLLRPELVLALGSPAARELLQTRRGIMSLRGRFMKTRAGQRVIATFHPAYLLHRPEAKREVWEDLQKVAGALDLPLPGRSARRPE